MATTSVRIQALLVLLFASACGRDDRPTAESVDAVLHSRDRVAVYDAGVDAYRRKDYGVARELWQRALALGDHNAASNLGFLFYYGLGGAADSARGIAYWRAAMARGDAEAHRHVAQAIVDGDARLGSETEAYGHALAARALALRGPEIAGEGVAADAGVLITRIGSRLSGKAKQAADSLAHLWADSHLVARRDSRAWQSSNDR